jgi:hypothetical protein
MGTALYTQAFNAISSNCPHHAGPATAWLDDLPANRPCFSEFRFVLTQLRSDDDEMFYDAPVYAESLTSWRLIDERWLVCRTTFASFDHVGVLTRFSLSDAMPR